MAGSRYRLARSPEAPNSSSRSITRWSPGIATGPYGYRWASMVDGSLVLALLIAITILAGMATRTGTPYPVVLVLGGLVMGAIPGIPSPSLDPDLVLVLFLPPLLYSAAFLSSVDDLRANAGPILALATGLVLVTVVGIAAIGVALVGLSWPVAFVLGAVLGPT